MHERRPRPLGLLSASALFAACTSASYAADADADVGRVLREADASTLGDRERNVLRPETQPLPPPAEPTAVPPEAPKLPGEPPRVLDLPDALTAAVQHNRDFLTRREGLYRSGLSITLTRFQFGPQLSAVVKYLWPQQENGTGSQGLGGTAAADQILPTGGHLSLNAGLDAQWPFGPASTDSDYVSSAGITLTQPLLRGAGRDIAYEPLTQAERDLTYAVRDFEQFREDFTIRIAQLFFDLVSQKKTLAIEDANYDAAVFDRKKAEALQQVGRNSEQEVFRARRQEITAKDQLIDARATYDRAVDSFKIELGLPTTAAIDVADAEPPYEPVRFALDSAVTCARTNRLDLQTERQRVEDSERALHLAGNALLPDLSLTASFGVAGAANDLGHASPDNWNSGVGLSFEVPLQRTPQRNAYRSAQISLEQARRGLQLLEDRLDLDIRDAVRRLRSTEERVVLQEDQINTERRAVTVMEIRYEAGTVDNRDLLEARQALVAARNALIRLKVDHFIARLRLLKDMGIFFVDERGMWR